MSRFGRWAAHLCFSLALLVPGLLAAQQAPARSVKIPDGTVVRLSLLDTLNSATNEVNDPVHFEAIEEVKVGDVVVIPKAATGLGHVAEVEKKKRMGRGGKLNFAVDYVKAFDGSNIRLRASSSSKGKDKTGTVIATTLLVSPLFLLMHGKDVNVPKGTQFNAYVDGDRELATGPAPTPAAPTGTQPAATGTTPSGDSDNLATVVVKSTPDGGDISVDGKFVGNTPSTLRLAPGDHTILIEKSGMKSWTRTMTISPGGIVTLDAKLEAAQ